MLATEQKRTSLNLFASLILHAGLLLIIGGTVIIQRNVPKEAFSGSYSGDQYNETLDTLTDLPEEEFEPQDLPNPMEAADPMAAAAASDTSSPYDENTIVADLSSSRFNISNQKALPTATITSPGGTGNGLGSGLGSGTQGRVSSGMRKIKLFSSEVETNRLGVLMDVSGSAANYIAPTLEEVERNFTDAPIVLVAGCGIAKDVPSRKVDVRKVRPEKTGMRPGFIPLFERIAGRSNDDEVKARLARIVKQDNVWGVYIEDDLKDSTITTRYGFDHLIDQGVDSIYWFADFTDAIDPGQLEAIMQIMKEKNIKLIAHNFSGGRLPDGIIRVAKETGGSTLRDIPGSSK